MMLPSLFFAQGFATGGGGAVARFMARRDRVDRRLGDCPLVPLCLGEAVFAACAWPADLTDEEILARLLELNLARAAAG